MVKSNINITLATEDDAPRLASLMTAGFASADAAFPLIWGSAPEGTHDMVAEKGLFTPVQKEGRLTFKALHLNEKIVGFATWSLPKLEASGSLEEARKRGLPQLPLVNMELWEAKMVGPQEFYYRDVEQEKDMRISPLSL